MEKILTVIICAYNMEKYIIEALESCKIKDMDKLEVLIMNDGSTDKTRDICEKYCKEYPYVFSLINKENAGWGSNVNMAVKMASGKYLRILDADDWFNTEKLQEFVSILSKIEVSLVTSLYREWNGNTIKTWDLPWKNYKTGDSISMKDIKENLGLGIWKVTFRTSLVQEHHMDLPEKALYMDTLFILQLLPYVDRVYFTDLYVYDYRSFREGQSTSVVSLGKHYQDLLLGIRKQLSFYKKMKNTCNYHQIFYRFAGTYAGGITNLIQISSLKLIDVSKTIRDSEIILKKEAPEVYRYVGHRKIIRAVRLCRYHFCSVLRWLFYLYHSRHN